VEQKKLMHSTRTQGHFPLVSLHWNPKTYVL